MTLPHLCYDRRAYLPLKTREKAGEGNRTPVCSLGSCRSAIELHPRSETFDFRFSKPMVIGSPNNFKVYSFRGCRLQPKQIVNSEPTLRHKSKRTTIHCHEITSSAQLKPAP